MNDQLYNQQAWSPDLQQDLISPKSSSSQNMLQLKQNDLYYSGASAMIQEVDEGTISPPMDYEKWREQRLKRIEEFSKLLSSNQSRSIDENMFSNRKKEGQAQRFAVSSQKQTDSLGDDENEISGSYGDNSQSNMKQNAQQDNNNRVFMGKDIDSIKGFNINGMAGEGEYLDDDDEEDDNSDDPYLINDMVQQQQIYLQDQNRVMQFNQQPYMTEINDLINQAVVGQHERKESNIEKNYNKPLQMVENKNQAQTSSNDDTFQNPFKSQQQSLFGIGGDQNSMSFKNQNQQYSNMIIAGSNFIPNSYFSSGGGQGSDFNLSKTPGLEDDLDQSDKQKYQTSQGGYYYTYGNNQQQLQQPRKEISNDRYKYSKDTSSPSSGLGYDVLNIVPQTSSLFTESKLLESSKQTNSFHRLSKEPKRSSIQPQVQPYAQHSIIEEDNKEISEFNEHFNEQDNQSELDVEDDFQEYQKYKDQAIEPYQQNNQNTKTPDDFENKIRDIKSKLDCIKQTIGCEMGNRNPLTMDSTSSCYNQAAYASKNSTNYVFEQSQLHLQAMKSQQTSEINIFTHPQSQFINQNTVILNKEVFGITSNDATSGQLLSSNNHFQYTSGMVLQQPDFSVFNDSTNDDFQNKISQIKQSLHTSQKTDQANLDLSKEFSNGGQYSKTQSHINNNQNINIAENISSYNHPGNDSDDGYSSNQKAVKKLRFSDGTEQKDIKKRIIKADKQSTKNEEIKQQSSNKKKGNRRSIERHSISSQGDNLNKERFTPSEVRLIQSQQEENQRLRSELKKAQSNEKKILKTKNKQAKRLKKQRNSSIDSKSKQLQSIESQFQLSEQLNDIIPQDKDAQRLEDLEKAVAKIVSSLTSSQFHLTMVDKNDTASVISQLQLGINKESSHHHILKENDKNSLIQSQVSTESINTDKEKKKLKSNHNAHHRNSLGHSQTASYSSQKKKQKPPQQNYQSMQQQQEEKQNQLRELENQIAKEQEIRKKLQRDKIKKEQQLIKYQSQVNNSIAEENNGQAYYNELEQERQRNLELRTNFLDQMNQVKDHLKQFRLEVTQSKQLMQSEMQTFFNNVVLQYHNVMKYMLYNKYIETSTA